MNIYSRLKCFVGLLMIQAAAYADDCSITITFRHWNGSNSSAITWSQVLSTVNASLDEANASCTGCYKVVSNSGNRLVISGPVGSSIPIALPDQVCFTGPSCSGVSHELAVFVKDDNATKATSLEVVAGSNPLWVTFNSGNKYNARYTDIGNGFNKFYLHCYPDGVADLSAYGSKYLGGPFRTTTGMTTALQLDVALKSEYADCYTFSGWVKGDAAGEENYGPGIYKSTSYTITEYDAKAAKEVHYTAVFKLNELSCADKVLKAYPTDGCLVSGEIFTKPDFGSCLSLINVQWTKNSESDLRQVSELAALEFEDGDVVNWKATYTLTGEVVATCKSTVQLNDLELDCSNYYFTQEDEMKLDIPTVSYPVANFKLKNADGYVLYDSDAPTANNPISADGKAVKLTVSDWTIGKNTFTWTVIACGKETTCSTDVYVNKYVVGEHCDNKF